jgi:hypothetical protein
MPTLWKAFFEMSELFPVVGDAADYNVFAVVDVATLCFFFVMVFQLLMTSLSPLLIVVVAISWTGAKWRAPLLRPVVALHCR